jgi:site-specific DNA-cytosine methylase
MSSGHVGWYAAIHDLFPTMEHIELANWQKQLWKSEYDKMLPLMVHGHYAYESRIRGLGRELDILAAHMPARTVTSSHNVLQRYIVLPDCVLKPTVKAIARLQTFPDWYQWPTSAGKAIEIVGNAVPCQLAQQLTLAYSQAHRDMEIVA